MIYEDFVREKLVRVPLTGMDTVPRLGEYLFAFQRDLVSWALRRGRAALFASTGLGKTRMQLEWARVVASETGGRVLILAPLAVTQQTAAEAHALGIDAEACREARSDRAITVINYDRLDRLDPRDFAGVVLDESSIIKHHDAQTFGRLCEAFASTPWRLCATATPAPNDFVELGTHAEFLGVCSRSEMLAEYFCHDGGDTSVWRLKGHARAEFWRWVSGWAAVVRHPRDLGYTEAGYDLPPLRVHHHTVAAGMAEARAAGTLFAMEAQSLADRRRARAASTESRVARCAEMVAASAEPWIVWCDLNSESTALTRAIPGAVEVTGSMPRDVKEAALLAFASGATRVLVTKPSIAGFGLNWQHCSHVAFVGVTDSWEAYYQAVRRCWRFGQTRPVDVHVFASEAEGSVIRNLQRKESDAAEMQERLSAETRDAVRAAVRGQVRQTNEYAPSRRMTVPTWVRSEP